MTEKLYYLKSHLYEFSAHVVDCFPVKDSIAIILDQTAFFPTGGGQACDTGFIEDSEVTDVFEEDGNIIHICKSGRIFNKGERVYCKIDGEIRFARMQAHSGEHIVSGIAHTMFCVENVGFHMDGYLMTVDFDKYLDKEQLELLEKEANKCVYSNVPITTAVYTAEEASKLAYRSKKDFDNDIRIVTIEGVDQCACCAPHVSNTGEIGLIKILSSVSHRGGVRITLICGIEAYKDYCIKYSQSLKVASTLAVKHNEIYQGVEMLLGQISSLKEQICTLQKKYCDFISERFDDNKKNILMFIDNGTGDELLAVAVNIMQKSDKLIVVCSGTDETAYSYVICKRNTLLNLYAKQINTCLNGRGGGRDELIRGSFKSGKDDIIQFFEEFESDRL